MDRIPYLRAILTETGDIEMYRNNAYFKTALDSYIEMIPIFVDGLKRHAEVEDKKYRNIAKQLREQATANWQYEGVGGLGWMDDR